MIGKFNTNAPSLKGVMIDVKPCFLSGTAACWGASPYFTFLNLLLSFIPFMRGQLYLFNTGFNP